MSDSVAVRAVTKIIETLQPNIEDVRKGVQDYRKANPGYGTDDLASNWADRACWLFAAEGAASALPGAIPGLGTAAQVAIEAGAISGDLAYMLRTMAGMTMGVATVYDRDLSAQFNDEFVKVLGVWCGALTLTKEPLERIAQKVAVAQFKRVPGEVFKRINRRVGTTILTKYGTKRGGVAIGKLVPFGVGALVGGSFNLATMKAFKRASVHYFKTTGGSVVMSE